MNELVINVGWEYFLGLMGSLLVIAWYTSARFTVLETSMKWIVEKVKSVIETVDELKLDVGELKLDVSGLKLDVGGLKLIVNELKVSNDNSARPAFVNRSPINLNSTGKLWLAESGMKGYIDIHKQDLITKCQDKQNSNPYEIQKRIFKLFEDIDFDPVFEDNLKKFAYTNGTTMVLLRRIGAIYFRDICIGSFGMHTSDIDKHVPISN